MKLTKWMLMTMATLAITGTAMAQDAGAGARGNRAARGDRAAAGDQAAQPGQPGQGGRFNRENMTDEQRQQFMQQMQQRFNERIKEALKVTDEEWTAIEPLINEVNKQRMSAGRGGRGGMRPGGRGGQQGGPAGDQGPQADPASAELQKVLASANSTDAQIKAAVEAYRASQAKARTR